MVGHPHPSCFVGSATGRRWFVGFAVAAVLGGCLGGDRRSAASVDGQDDASDGAEDAGCGPEACAIGDACVAAGTPSADNPCAACVPGRSIDDWTRRDDGVACDDLDGCTLDTTCAEGRCVGTRDPLCDLPRPSCVAEVVCTTRACEPVLVPDRCFIDGACAEPGEVSGADPCAWCAPAVATRSWTPNGGAACDDADPCTVDDICDAAGACAGVAMDCDDAQACTADTCVAGTCEHTLDAGACLVDETCYAPKDTAEGNACLVCDLASPEAWTALDAVACDDADACTVTDRCHAGVCAGVRYNADPEPNDELASAANLGTASPDLNLPFPSGTVVGTLNPAGEVDWFGFTYPTGPIAAPRRPRVALSGLDALAQYEVCLFARCGTDANATAPVVTCGSEAVSLPGGFAGCCAVVSGAESAATSLSAVCADRTSSGGFGVARVRLRTLDGTTAPCPSYSLAWGTAPF